MAETPRSSPNLSVRKETIEDGIADGMSYRRYNPEGSGSSDENETDEDWDEKPCLPCRHSCGKKLGPVSPERAPGFWMLLNALLLSWSLSLGLYGLLLLAWYGNDTLASRANTTDYLLWSLLTTLVWVVEISLRAAFPPLDTFLVVATPSDESATNAVDSRPPSEDEENSSSNNNDGYRHFVRTLTMEESVVTLERTIQKRSTKHLTVIATELLLALFFGIETVMDCWNYWNHHYGGATTSIPENTDSYDYETYYGYEDSTGDSDNHYSMLQQQSDIWINVLAYAYMTYETYHEYKRSTTTTRNIQRSLSSTLLQYHQQRSSRSATTVDIASPEASSTAHGNRREPKAESSSSLLGDAEVLDYGVCRPPLAPTVRRSDDAKVATETSSPVQNQ